MTPNSAWACCHLEGSGSHLVLQPVFSAARLAARWSSPPLRSRSERDRAELASDQAALLTKRIALGTARVRDLVRREKYSAARPLQALAATRLQPWWCAKYHLLLQVGSEQDRSRCRRGCVKKRRMHSSARGVVHDLLRSRLASNGLSCWPSLHAAVRPRKHAHVFVYVVCTIKSF